MGVAERLRQRMKERGHWKEATDEPNIHAAAAAARIPYATLHGIVSGETKAPSLRTLERLAEAYDVTVEWLLRGSDVRTAGTFEQGAEYAVEAVRATLDNIMREIKRGRAAPRGGGAKRLDGTELKDAG